VSAPLSGTPQANAAAAQIIRGDDIIAAFNAAMQIGEEVVAEPITIEDVEIYDNYWRPKGFDGAYMLTRVSFPRLKLPAGQMTLPGDNPLAEVVIACDTTLVPVTVQVGALRWAGWFTVAEDKINEDSTETVECTIAGLLTMLDCILVYPEPELPLAIQPSEAIYIGPGITCLKAMVAENAFRLQSDWMEPLDTILSLDLDYRTWFDSWNLPDLEWVYVPIFVPPWDSAEDESNWIFFHGRMDTCWKLMKQQLEDNGWYASLDVWLLGDPQPQWTIFGVTSTADLKVASYIFNVKDYSGVSGRAANWSEGLAKELVTLEGSILGEQVIGPVEAYVPPGSNIVIAPAYGINYTPPFIIFNGDADQSGLITLNVAHHAPQSYRAVLGGQSPAWLSAALNATMEYAVDMLTIAIGVTGIPDDLLNGILDGTFLAFQLFVNYTAKHAMGPYGPPEKFFPTNSTYDIDMLFAAINALWQIKGYPAAQFSFINGLPFAVGRDAFPGAQASVIRRGVLYTDYFDDIVIEDSNEGFAKVTGQVGDGRREEAPGLIWQRRLTEAMEDINLILLAPPGGTG
jgi:hypothetical protein